MEWLQTCIARSPKLAQMVGQALYGLGGFLIVAGLLAHAGMTAINLGRTRGNLPALRSISEAYPAYPLWFVPEGPFGYIVAVLLAGLGIYVALCSKRILKATSSRARRRSY